MKFRILLYFYYTKKFVFIFLFLHGFCFAQNWNVFNKAYRYNYKYNFSQLISNVLFVDSVKFLGSDTIYALNRIGVECTGSCPTVTAALTPSVNYLVPNMPQFLQRRIYKYPDGKVQLFDTTKIVIIPTCTLNQSWLFDSIYNKTAVCVNISTVNVFGIIDSVKTLMIDGVDSLELSKSFGILKFPDLYNKNKYFRLVGIENKNLYSIVALFGEKVPNAWDFYDYQVGDEYCYSSSSEAVTGFMNPPVISNCTHGKVIILGKTISVDAYSYLIDQDIYSRQNVPASGACYAPVMAFNHGQQTVTITFTSLPSATLECNNMYPGMVFEGQGGGGLVHRAKFQNDNNGNFYKYCGNYLNGQSGNAYLFNNSLGVYEKTGYDYDLAYKVGCGKLLENMFYFEASSNYTATFVKTGSGGTCTFPFFIGLPEENKISQLDYFYPNPSNEFIQFHSKESYEIKISNSLGQNVLIATAEADSKIDVSHLSEGIYFVRLQNSHWQASQKLIIQR